MPRRPRVADGPVPTYFVRALASEAVRHVRGVRDVTNYIRVEPAATVRDIRRRIVQALHRSAEVDARSVAIVVDGSAVLGSISARFGVGVDMLVDLNRIRRQDALVPGQVLAIDNRHIAVHRHSRHDCAVIRVSLRQSRVHAHAPERCRIPVHAGGHRHGRRHCLSAAFGNPAGHAHHDGAHLHLGGARLAFSTDSYVVQPLFFPGGDIGTLAINGTVNDLAMCGARPQFLSVGFVIEEGLPMDSLRRIVSSMQAAAQAAGVTVVTGDTKVVDRGKGDGVYLNTAGVGLIEYDGLIAPASVRPGDVVLLSGDIGRHGMAVMAAREGLQFESAIESDCAPLAEPVLALIDEGVTIHCLRDLTRGGVASATVEIAEATGLHIRMEEHAIAIREDVRGACEILGFDPLYVANEGRFIAFVPAAEATRALDILRRHAVSRDAVAIGTVSDDPRGLVTLKSRIGATRVVDMLSGEQLPRIC